MAIACGKLNSDGLCRIYYIQERIKSERQEKFGLCGHLSLWTAGLQHEDLSLITRIQKSGLVACTCHPSARKAKTGGYLGLTSQPAQSTSRAQAIKRLLLIKQSRWILRNDTRGWPLATIHMHTYMYAYLYIYTHTCIHTQKSKKIVMRSGNGKEHLLTMLGWHGPQLRQQLTISKETPTAFRRNRQIGNWTFVYPNSYLSDY